MNENYIQHHGIEGQKWGEKNGPPYPLENSKKMGKRITNRMKIGIEALNKFLEENKKKRIDKIKLSDNAKVISDNIGLFSTQELQDKINRQRMLKELEDRIPKKKDGFIKKTISGFSNGLSSKLSNALVDKIVGEIVSQKNKYTYEEAKKIAKDYREGKKDKFGNTYAMSPQDMESLFKLLNSTQSIDRILK